MKVHGFTQNSFQYSVIRNIFFPVENFIQFGQNIVEMMSICMELNANDNKSTEDKAIHHEIFSSEYSWVEWCA